MRLFAPVAVLMVMLLCGFALAPASFGPGGDNPSPDPKQDDDRMDTSDSTMDMYKSGTIKAQYWVTVHKDPKVGQYWETAGEAYGTKTTQRWQVAKVEGKQAVVEWQMKMDSEYMISNYVLAFLVDLEKEAGDANVTKAWIGKPGKDAESIEVMDMPEATACGGGAADYETTTEDFKDLELAGAKWSGKVTEIKGDGWAYKTWAADDGWFGGILKTEMDGKTQSELQAKGDDAKPLLKWDDAELAKLLKKDAEDKPADEKKNPTTEDGPKKEDKTDGKKEDK